MSTQPIYTVRFTPVGDPTAEPRFVTRTTDRETRVRTFHTEQAAIDAKTTMDGAFGHLNTYEVVFDTIDGPDPTDELVAQQVAVVDNLRAQLETCQSSLRGAERRHHEDIEAISDRLIQEATDRGWCSQYDDIVNDVNRSLHVSLLTRAKDFTVTFEVRVQVPVSVTCRDENEAINEAREQLTTHAVQYAVREQGYDEHDYEVEED